ncbi:IS3 family transposase [Mucilaginibacter sp. HD30]
MKMQSCSRGLRELCRLLGHSPQAYYQYQKALGKSVLEDDLIIAQVLAHRLLQPKLGGRKLYAMMEPFMADHHIVRGRDRVFDLLRENGLLNRKRRHSKPRTTDSNHWMKKYPDLIKGIVLSRSEELWVSDITYIRLKKSIFAYLSLVTDAYSRKIVGYHMNKDLSVQGPVAALEMALKERTGNELLIHHSDRGSQYCCENYIGLLNQAAIAISMTQSGDPRDNAIAERVNGILKLELLKEVYPHLTSARESAVTAVEIYNSVRLHSSIDMMTPDQAHGQTGPIQRKWKSWVNRPCRNRVPQF